MRTRFDMQSIAPFIFEYFFNGLRSRMAPGLLLPHRAPMPATRVRCLPGRPRYGCGRRGSRLKNRGGALAGGRVIRRGLAR